MSTTPPVLDQSKPSLGGQVVRNAAWSVAVNALAAPLNLAATGLALERMGADRYGVWAVLAVFANYLRLGDFGLSAAFARRVAALIAEGDYRTLSRGLSSVASLVVAVSIPILLLLWFVRNAVLFAFLNVPRSFETDAVTAYGYMLTASFCTLLSPVFASLLVGAQRTDREKQISGIASVVFSLGLIITVLNQGEICDLAIVQLTASVVGLILFMFAARRTIPQVSLVPFISFDRREAWSLLRFGIGLQLTQAAMNVMTQADRLVLSHYMGPAVAGIYDVALKALYSMQSVSNQLIAPLYSAAARLQAEGRIEDIERWIVRAGRIFASVVGPAYGLACVGAPVIVEAWIGRPEPRIAATVALIAAVQAANIGNGPGYYMLVGTGRLKPIMTGSLVAAVLGIAIAWGTVSTLQFYGVVAAHALAVFTLIVWVAVSIRRAFGTSVGLQFRLSIVPFAVGAIEGGMLNLMPSLSVTSRLATLLTAAVLTVPGFLALWRFGYLTEEDRNIIRRLLPDRLRKMSRSAVSPDPAKTMRLPTSKGGPLAE